MNKNLLEGVKIEMKNHKEKTWRPSTLEQFFEFVEITRKVILETKDPSHCADDYTKERAIWNIVTGRVVDTPVMMFRLAEGEDCPYCHAKFIKLKGALSRKDNETYICADCGLREAVEDIRRVK